MKYILASGSPRRKELFSTISDDFEIDISNSDETAPAGIAHEDLPSYLAAKKGLDVAKRHPEDLVIACDTAVILGETVLGKPHSRSEAKGMMILLSGKTHSVITGCFLCLGDKTMSFSEKTDVTFYPLSDSEMEQYVSTDEPYDKAGGYGIQGIGKLLVKKINGDYFNVMGLPVARLKRMIDLFLNSISE